VLPRRLDLGGSRSGPFLPFDSSFQRVARLTPCPWCGQSYGSSPLPPLPYQPPQSTRPAFPVLPSLVYVHKILSIRGLVVIREPAFMVFSQSRRPFPSSLPFAGLLSSSVPRKDSSCALPASLTCKTWLVPLVLAKPSFPAPLSGHPSHRVRHALSL
jgi:hypothetical protein